MMVSSGGGLAFKLPCSAVRVQPVAPLRASKEEMENNPRARYAALAATGTRSCPTAGRIKILANATITCSRIASSNA